MDKENLTAFIDSLLLQLFHSLTDQNADPGLDQNAEPGLDPKFIFAGDSMLNSGPNCGGQGFGMLGAPGLDKYQ